MLLKELISQLVYGELSQLPLGDDHDHGELTDGYEAIMPHINLALTAIHTRLFLREESLTIRLDESIDKYYINPKFAESNDSSIAPIKYIIDAHSPYLGNSLKIEKLTDSSGEDVLLNNSSIKLPVYTPTPNTLKFDTPATDVEYTVTFRADHPKIDILEFDQDTEELDIPDFALDPLIYFIASRVHASYPSLEGTNESLVYRQKFEASIAELSDHGLIDTSSDSNFRLESNGWA